MVSVVLWGVLSFFLWKTANWLLCFLLTAAWWRAASVLRVVLTHWHQHCSLVPDMIFRLGITNSNSCSHELYKLRAQRTPTFSTHCFSLVAASKGPLTLERTNPKDCWHKWSEDYLFVGLWVCGLVKLNGGVVLWISGYWFLENQWTRLSKWSTLRILHSARSTFSVDSLRRCRVFLSTFCTTVFSWLTFVNGQAEDRIAYARTFYSLQIVVFVRFIIMLYGAKCWNVIDVNKNYFCRESFEPVGKRWDVLNDGTMYVRYDYVDYVFRNAACIDCGVHNFEG